MLTLLTMVEERGSIALTDLATLLDTSGATVRRDVADLATQGLVTRRHGLVQRLDRDKELPVELRDAAHRAAKRAIAKAAIGLIPAGRHTVALTGGTTTTEVLRALSSRSDLTLVTNSVALALEASHQDRSRVLVVGGVLRPYSQELVGSLAENTFAQLKVETAIVGCDAVSAAGGVTTHDAVEARTNHTMLTHAARVIVVADGSKVGRRTPARLAGIDEVQALVTDESADPAEIARIRAAGVEVVTPAVRLPGR